VGARVVAAEVTIAGIYAAQPASSPGTDRDLGTVGIPSQSGIQGADEQPVTALRSHIAVKSSGTGNRGHQRPGHGVGFGPIPDETIEQFLDGLAALLVRAVSWMPTWRKKLCELQNAKENRLFGPS
jgi:hypothetical protein